MLEWTSCYQNGESMDFVSCDELFQVASLMTLHLEVMIWLSVGIRRIALYLLWKTTRTQTNA